MYFYTYVLLSGKDNKFYTGSADDLKGRFEEHCHGRVSSTKDRRPLELVYYEACRDRKDARHRESYLKTYHGKMFLRSRLKSYLTGCLEK
ncbi:MAG: GIY-YIG nuclease family protein [bacterium]|nr:GIY-YIG nuclease family protein [bacterium]